MKEPAQASPIVVARFGGVLYLVIIAIGIFGEVFVRGDLVVHHDMAATVQNIQTSLSLWRLSVMSEFVLVICATALAYVFYRLLKPANKDVALAILVFNIVAIGLEATNRFNLFSVLTLVDNTTYLTALGQQAVYAQVQLALESYTYGFAASLLVFGVEIVMVGYLIYQSQYLPKLIGVLMTIAGVCYITNTVVLILAPDLFSLIFPTILMPCFLAELSFAAWLLIKGVNAEQWNEQEVAYA